MKYESIAAVNWSTLKEMNVSPKHYRYRLQNPRQDTPALALGRAVHAAVYEPDVFERRYVAYPGKVRRGAEWEEFKAEHAGCDIITQDERAMAMQMRNALLAEAGDYLRGGFAEQTLTWTDEETGMPCKGRVDQVNGRLIELKTTRSASPHGFATDARKFGYHGQLAFYTDGLAANGIELEGPPLVIACQSEPPHDVVVYETAEATLASGRRLYRQLLVRLVECHTTGHWPGVANGEVLPFEVQSWDEPEETLTLGGIAVEMG